MTEVPPVLELRSDQPHTLFFKGGGYETRMLVLETQTHEGRPKLSPSDPCREMRFVERNRNLEIEIEPGSSENP
ncbi:hypothetical protein MK489_03510 [Myxococcota bacterium]|nr:hypothetical protein [Myxococcota bacterium]